MTSLSKTTLLVRKLFIGSLVQLLVFVFGVTQAHADQPAPITIQPVIGFTNFSQALNTIFTAAIFFGAILALVYIIIAAVKYVAAGDDAGNVKAARTTMTNATVGLVLLALVYVIFQFLVRIIPGLGRIFSGA